MNDYKTNGKRSLNVEPAQIAAVIDRLPEPLQPVIRFAHITGGAS